MLQEYKIIISPEFVLLADGACHNALRWKAHLRTGHLLYRVVAVLALGRHDAHRHFLDI